MRVVLETSVLVSAILTVHGACARIVDLLVEGELDLFADDRILAECTSVLQCAELHIDPPDEAVLFELMSSISHPAAGVPLPAQLPDLEGTAFLEAPAVSHSYLITGNTRHYPEGSRAGVKVPTPREFLELLRSR